MATRSFIAIKNKDNSYEAIYCHWDGYPEWNGIILQTYYTSEEKVRSLLRLGDLSSLGPELGPTPPETPCEARSLYTQAYHRDRGEPKESTGTKHFHLFLELKETAKDWGAEYLYVFDTEDNSWTCIDLLRDKVIKKIEGLPGAMKTLEYMGKLYKQLQKEAA